MSAPHDWSFKSFLLRCNFTRLTVVPCMMIGDLIQGREKSQILLIEGLHNAYNNINICKNIVLYLPVNPQGQGLVLRFIYPSTTLKNTHTCFRVVEGYKIRDKPLWSVVMSDATQITTGLTFSTHKPQALLVGE